MECKHAQKMLADYVNEVLETEDSRRLQQHIAECENCRWELEILRKVLGLIDDVKVEYPSASVWENFIPDLHRRIENEAALMFMKQQRRRLYLLPGWAATAAVVLVLFASLMMWNRPAIRSTQVQIADSIQATEDPSLTKDSSGSMLVAGVISEVLITEAEAEKLKSLSGTAQPGIPVFPYYYHYGDDDEDLIDTNSDTDTVLDDEDVIKYLEDEFAEFDKDPMMESDDGEFDAI